MEQVNKGLGKLMEQCQPTFMLTEFGQLRLLFLIEALYRQQEDASSSNGSRRWSYQAGKH